MRYYHGIFVFLVSLMLFCFQAEGAALEGQEKQQMLKRLSNYFAQLKPLRAEIVQKNPDDSQVKGVLYLDLPGRFRLDYEEPDKVTLIGTGTRLFLVDYALEEVVALPEEATFLSLILQKKPNFLKPNLVILSLERRGGKVFLTLSEKRFRDQGYIMLVFLERPLMLQQWVLVDALGQKIQVDLVAVENNITPPKQGFFTLKNIWKKTRDEVGAE